MVLLPAPGCPPCFQSRNESSAVVQEVPQEQATDGCSKESTEWHQYLNNPAENCIRKLLLFFPSPRHLSLQQDQHFQKGGREKTAWVRNHFKHPRVNRPSLQNQSCHVQVPPPELSAVKEWLLVCKRVLTLLSLHQHRICSHITSHSTVLRCYNDFQLHSVKTR